MDIALELCDTYVFDHMYAALLPAKPAPYSLSGASGNASISDFKAASPWQFEPASSLISFSPSDAAYMSQWNRDNIFRQAFSLFLITWWVKLH
jgi:lathosterol oxidase